jgi:hypothetical protein
MGCSLGLFKHESAASVIISSSLLQALLMLSRVKSMLSCTKSDICFWKWGFDTKKWYDCDLKKQRKELYRKGALLSIYPFDHNIKNSYFKLRRIYNKNIKVISS